MSSDFRPTSTFEARQSRQNSGTRRGSHDRCRLRRICLSNPPISLIESPGRPRQASLRRAVSTAYYALFHLLIQEATRNWKRAQQRPLLARAFEHGRMKVACDKKRTDLNTFMRRVPQPPANQRTSAQHLHTVVNTFIEAQQQRHTA